MDVPDIKSIVKAVFENPSIEAEELGLSAKTLERIKKSDAYKMLLGELENGK